MIEWYPQGKQGHLNLKGYVGVELTYFIYLGNPILVDARDASTPECDWLNLDIPFGTVEEAKKWCETVEITGAYK
jgi:hypothetical protein